MTIETTYDKQLKILSAHVHEHLRLEDIQNFMLKILSSKDIPSDTNTIWDINLMAFDNIDIEFQQEIVEMQKKFEAQRGDAKIAIVSNYPLGDHIIKLFLILMKEASQDVKAFKTKEDAISWFDQA